MAQRVVTPVRYRPAGGLNSDSDPLDQDQRGDYFPANNIHHVTRKGMTSDAVETATGNTPVYQLPTVVAQNKKFRIYLNDYTDPSSNIVSIKLYSPNGGLLASAAWKQFPANVNQVYTNAVTSINANWGTQQYIIGALVLTSSVAGYFDLEVTTIPTWDYDITVSSLIASNGFILIQEAIDVSSAGDLHTIGSFDVDGDLMVWSTPQQFMSEKRVLTNVIWTGSNYRVFLNDVSGIANNSNVYISGSGFDVNGSWIVNVNTGLNYLDLLGTTQTSNSGNFGEVTLNVNGVGEVGVALRDDNTSTWTYTTLLRSKEWNFRVPKPPKIKCERNDLSLNCYWTDNFNPYRRFYYQGAYMLNGALNFVNPMNSYVYGTIYNSTRLFQGNGIADLGFLTQLQSGGALFSGNYRYMIRFLDEFFNPTLWTDPSGIFVVSNNTLTPSNSLSVAELVQGNASTKQTAKINQLQISGIIPNLFKFVELAALFYVDGSSVPVGTIVRRDLLNQNATQNIQHTGNETNVQVLDINKLLQVQADILTGLNIDIVATRLIPSNTTSHASLDLHAWLDNMKYNLFMDSLPAIGTRFQGTLNVGEYQVPQNTFSKMAFMLNEQYRLSGKIEFLNGAYAENFHFSDIRFDMSATSPDGKRTAGLPFMDLTDVNATQIFIPALQITNINWDFLIDGIAVRNLVKRIHWEMVEMKEAFREVLGDGVQVMSTKYTQTTKQITSNDPQNTHVNGFMGLLDEQNTINGWGDLGRTTQLYFASYNGIRTILGLDNTTRTFGSGAQDLTDFVFACGSDYQFRTLDFVSNQQIPYNGATLTSDMFIQPVRNYGSFYSYDQILHFSSYSKESGDKLIVYGAPNRVFVGSAGGRSGVESERPNFSLFSGWTNTVANKPIPYDITDAVNISRGGTARFSNGTVYSKGPWRLIGNVKMFNSSTVRGFRDGEYVSQDLPSGPALQLNTNVGPNTGAVDMGVYRAQIFRAKVDKFGDPANSKYVPTGAISGYLETTTNVYGDTFVQQHQMKHYRTADFGVVTDTYFGLSKVGASWNFAGQESGLLFYSQDRVNVAMISKDDSSDSVRYPVLSEGEWLNVNGINTNTAKNANYFLDYKNSSTGFIQVYNTGYTSQQGVTADAAFDTNLPKAATTPARFWWSLPKPEDSIDDPYAIILPLNFKDEDLTNGDIWHTIVANGMFFTLQERNVVRQYIDDSTLITTSEGQAVFGNAGVATQRGSQLSGYGTIHGFGVILGKTNGGKDAFVYIDTKLGKIVRHDPSQGTTVLSDIHTMRAFTNNNFTFASLDSLSIRGVWDEQNSEYIWTVRAHKKLPNWDKTSGYQVGNEVIYGTSGFNEIPDIYVLKTPILPGDKAPDINNKWRKIDHADPNYYNYFTLAFNEEKNKFTTFYSFLPKIYLKRGKYFLSPRPVGKETITYEHYHPDSEICVWYKDGASEQAENWYIAGMIINHDANINKHAMATLWQTLVVPERVDVESKSYKTFMLASDFSTDHDQFKCPVKNDTLTANNSIPVPVNEQDTSFIFGSYLKFTLSGSPRIYQKFYNFICKIRNMTRFYNS